MQQLNNDQFVDLILNYRINMYRLAFSILHSDADAQDAVSEAVLKSYEVKSSLRDISKFKPWIMQIVANEAKQIYRKSKRSECPEDIEVLQFSHVDELHELWDVVMRLECIHREIIILYFYEQLQINEISKILHIAEGTVKSRLFRAKKLLKSML